MTHIKPEGTLTWQSPSNIAIVKYWGKKGVQLPENPSFSLTLSAAHTRSKAVYRIDPGLDSPKITIVLDGVDQPDFVPRISQFFQRISDTYPFVNQLDIRIETHNSFPHSSGIASSASAMSALALIICEIAGHSEDLAEVSRVARLGSGSACRSVYPYGAVWGKSGGFPGSKDTFAIGAGQRMHDVFKSLRDAILIVKSGKKQVSSSAGHGLMQHNPYAPTRYRLAEERMLVLGDILPAGDLETFGAICEREALELHALMMCSNPPYLLMEAGTVEMIKRIQAFRNDTGTAVYFTLDAGPNIHLIYPDSEQERVHGLIRDELLEFCENGRWIDDHVGTGPEKINLS